MYVHVQILPGNTHALLQALKPINKPSYLHTWYENTLLRPVPPEDLVILLSCVTWKSKCSFKMWCSHVKTEYWSLFKRTEAWHWKHQNLESKSQNAYVLNSTFSPWPYLQEQAFWQTLNWFRVVILEKIFFPPNDDPLPRPYIKRWIYLFALMKWGIKTLRYASLSAWASPPTPQKILCSCSQELQVLLT